MQGAIDAGYLNKVVADLTDAPSMTGANKTALSTSVIYRAVIESNTTRLSSGVTGVGSVIAVTSRDGVQRDFSFQQHGGILYNGNYGFGFLRDVTWVGAMLSGTQYAFSATQTGLLRDNFLQGTRWMIRNGLLAVVLGCGRVPRSASLGHRALCAALLALCVEPSACTPAAADFGPTSLERHVDDSGVNKALLFDGEDDYATTATAAFPDGHSQYTLSTWFRLDSLTGKQAFITVRKDFDSGLGLGVNDGIVSAWRVFGDRTLVAAPKAVTVDTWHHAAYTFDKTTNQLYLDGVLVASSDSDPDKRTPTTCWLGTLEGTSELLHGSLDDVHVFEVVRTTAQIASELSKPVSNDETGLVMNLTFDESEGPIVYDHSTLENDGQLGDGIVQRMPTRAEPRKAAN